MNQPPAFQFYVDNFIEGTSEMSPHEVGCYVRLLCHQWSRGQIPTSDTKKLRRVAGGVVSKNVLDKFTHGKNERLERERHKQQVWREKSREGGIKSGLTRASRVLQPPLEPPLEPNRQPNGNTPIPFPSPPPGSNNNNKVPSLEEVKTNAQFIGQSPQDAELFWHHFESTGWIDKNGHPVISWKSKQQTWKTQSQSLSAPLNGHRKAGVSESANAIIRAEEYKRVCAEISRIQTNGAQDAMGAKLYSQKEKTDLQKLRSRRAVLRSELGITL